MVLATDNPIEYEGTYPLPEAQLDRFIARVASATSTPRARPRWSAADWPAGRPARPAQVTDAARLLAMRESLELVQLHPDLLAYVVALVAATRDHPQVTVGASPRGTLAVVQLARGHAALAGRSFVTPEDIKAVAVPALAHRLVLRPEMWVRRVTGEDVAREILAQVPVPRGTTCENPIFPERAWSTPASPIAHRMEEGAIDPAPAPRTPGPGGWRCQARRAYPRPGGGRSQRARSRGRRSRAGPGALVSGPAGAEPGHGGAARPGRRDRDRAPGAGPAGRAGAGRAGADAAAAARRGAGRGRDSYPGRAASRART